LLSAVVVLVLQPHLIRIIQIKDWKPIFSLKGAVVLSSRRSFPSDLNTEEWLRVRNHVPPLNIRGRPPILTRRELLNAMLYVSATTCGWRQLPQEFGPWQRVYHHYRLWKLNGSWNKIYTALEHKSVELEGGGL